jgi:ABC-type uncharacterized transport system ATPase subunit
MSTSPLKKIFDAIINSNEPYFCEDDESVSFSLKHMGNHVEIIGKINAGKVLLIDVQYNYYKVFVVGKVAIGGDKKNVRRFKREFELPEGARKSKIDAVFHKKGTRVNISVPIKQKTQEKVSLLDNNEDFYSIYGTA